MSDTPEQVVARIAERLSDPDISIDALRRLTSAFEDLWTNAQEIIAEWKTLDPELQEQYYYDAQWLVCSVETRLGSTVGHPELPELHSRIVKAAASFLAHKADLQDYLGIHPELLERLATP